MALKTNLKPNELYDFSGIIESGQVVLYDRPLTLYSRESSGEECSIVLNASQLQNLNLPEIVLDGNYFQFDSVPSTPSNHRSDQDLAVLEILCNNSPVPDQPEFIDVDQLTDLDKLGPALATLAVSCVRNEEEDADDDVVFVKEYKLDDTVNGEADQQVALHSRPKQLIQVNVPKVRRNPIRTTRNKSRDISMEVLYEEDFAFLDSTDDEEDDSKENKLPETSPVELPKEWPINVHERPEYNIVTQKIESFDYTIREIQKKVPPKKPRLETVPVRRKSKKKYLSRKKKQKVVTEKRTPLNDLQPLVNSTSEMLKNFYGSLEENKHVINRDKDNLRERTELLRNQAVLYSLVNDKQESDGWKKFSCCLLKKTK
nr:unnamed protein product [Callosobruchus chinensis]